MGYHDLSECTLTDDERLAEAGRILAILEREPEDLNIRQFPEVTA